MATLLLGADGRADDDLGVTALHRAGLLGGVSDMARLVLEDPGGMSAADVQGCTLLHYAVVGGGSGVVEPFLRAGADLDLGSARGVRPLRLACRSGHGAIADRLLAWGGGDVDAAGGRGETARWGACRRGDVGLARGLLSHGVAGPRCPQLRGLATLGR